MCLWRIKSLTTTCINPKNFEIDPFAPGYNDEKEDAGPATVEVTNGNLGFGQVRQTPRRPGRWRLIHWTQQLDAKFVVSNGFDAKLDILSLYSHGKATSRRASPGPA